MAKIILSKNTVAQYKLNETTGSVVADYSGNGFNGTLYGRLFDNPPEVADVSNVSKVYSDTIIGKENCFDLYVEENTEGRQNYFVEIPDNDAFSFVDNKGDTAFSISLWVHLDNWLNTIHSIASKISDTLGYEWWLWASRGKVYFRLHSKLNVSYKEVVTADAVLETGQWANITVSYDGNKDSMDGMAIYINGVKVAVNQFESSTGYDGMVKTDAPVQLGKGSTFDLFGKLENVCIFNKVINQEEIDFLVNNGDITELLDN